MALKATRRSSRKGFGFQVFAQPWQVGGIEDPERRPAEMHLPAGLNGVLGFFAYLFHVMPKECLVDGRILSHEPVERLALARRTGGPIGTFHYSKKLDQ